MSTIELASPSREVPATPTVSVDFYAVTEAVDLDAPIIAEDGTQDAIDQSTQVQSPLPPLGNKRRALIAMATALLVVGSAIGAVLMATRPSDEVTHDVSVGASANNLGVCYDTFEASIPGKLDEHFRRIKERFVGVRTFTLAGKARNPIDVAAENNLSIYAGVWVKGNLDGLADMQAALDGARRHPQAIKAIMVGNEELQDQTNTEDQLIAKVRQMKQMLKAGGVTNVKVGSVQTDGSWLWARKLAAECDVVGVNIYPFFGGSPVSISNPIQDLAYRYNNITDRYGKGKVVLTETGWPTGGQPFNGHVPGIPMAKKYLNDVIQWVKQGNGGDMPTYFMFHDNVNKNPSFEKAFGVAWANAYWKFQFNTTTGVTGDEA
ncbi:Aste57867_20766 [Aphanomyces stellatus]|uniref:glucan endo-1,3-beta-D-glucosidase n=1 Tax=Aphanomyces stellatus TaxID=120398 RepID=A0A485LKH0_9STRA|nr:hypothetical protein As57867_020698 [Aphanomyces stellatus]VFT97445.1 Aste57867_20766 [Aphanomyces stellatus]